jgi:hypothetical protein
MNRTLSALFSALEGLLVVAIGLAIPLAPLTVLWGAQYGFAPDWLIFWRTAADIWMVGHGVDITVTLDAVTAKASGLAGAGAPFTVSITALGFALLTAVLGVRAGRRIAETHHRLLGELVATGVVALLSLGIVVSASQPLARPSIAQGILAPTIVFVLGLLMARYRQIPAPAFVRGWRDDVRATIATALRAGGAAAAVLMTVSSLVLAVLLCVGYGQIIGLYEGLHAGALGGTAITVAQLMVLPNLVVWTASWLVGPGFAIGAGSTVSPLATSLGPIPAIPIFGALPTGSFDFSFAGLVIPVLGGFLAGAILARQLSDQVGTDGRGIRLLAAGVGAGIVGGVLVGVLAWSSGGGVGPGRLQDVGPDALRVGLLAALEIGVGALLGLAAASRTPGAARR